MLLVSREEVRASPSLMRDRHPRSGLSEDEAGGSDGVSTAPSLTSGSRRPSEQRIRGGAGDRDWHDGSRHERCDDVHRRDLRVMADAPRPHAGSTSSGISPDLQPRAARREPHRQPAAAGQRGPGAVGRNLRHPRGRYRAAVRIREHVQVDSPQSSTRSRRAARTWRRSRWGIPRSDRLRTRCRVASAALTRRSVDRAAPASAGASCASRSVVAGLQAKDGDGAAAAAPRRSAPERIVDLRRIDRAQAQPRQFGHLTSSSRRTCLAQTWAGPADRHRSR